MMCLDGLLSHDFLGSILTLELKALWNWTPGQVSIESEARWHPLLVTHQDSSLFSAPSLMRQDSPWLDRPSPFLMMPSPAMLMMGCTTFRTSEQVDFCNKFCQNPKGLFKDLDCNYSISCRRMVSPFSAQVNSELMVDKTYWLVGTSLCHDGPELQKDPPSGVMIGSSMQSSCPAIGVFRMLTKSPPSCSILWVLTLNHENAFEPVNRSHLRSIARIRARLDLKASVHSARRRSSSLLDVLFVVLNLIIKTIMENSSSSAASSPDPLVELEADVKVLKR